MNVLLIVVFIAKFESRIFVSKREGQTERERQWRLILSVQTWSKCGRVPDYTIISRTNKQQQKQPGRNASDLKKGLCCISEAVPGILHSAQTFSDDSFKNK